MKVWMASIVVAAAMLAGAGVAVDQPTAPAADAFRQRLESIDERIGRITDLRADFEQRKHTALLKQPMVSKGDVVVKGDRVLWSTRSPRPSAMAIGEGRIRIHYPEAKVVEEYRVEGDLRELSGTPLPRLELLRRRFEIEPMDAAALGAPADGGDRYVAAWLTPRGEDLKRSVAEVRVLLDATVPCVSRLVITDPDGERTEIDFSNVRVNTGVAEAELDLVIPEGTRVSRPMGGGAPASPTEPPRR